MSTWAVWAIEDVNGEAGKEYWAETLHGVTLVQAGEIAEQQMHDKGWYGVGLRTAGKAQGGKWGYLSMRDGPTDERLLRPWRKKKQDWPELPMEIES